MDSVLTRLGFSAFEEAALAALPEELRKLVPARVVGQHRREWDVRGVELSSRAYLAGKRWAHDRESDAAQPTIGDWVLVRTVSNQGLPIIEHVLPRRTSIVRGAAGARHERQVVAANVDIVFMVSAASARDARADAILRATNPRRLERYLTAIENGGAKAVFVVNKADLDADARTKANELEKRLARPVILTSARGEPGVGELASYLAPRLTVGFLGMSGVGKSSLVNALFGESIQKVHEERQSDSRGRHTTTHRQLFELPTGTLVIDTPGMREFALAEGDEDDLRSFSDITDLARSCRFADCSHEREPGCAVRPAIESGEIELDRLAHYNQLKKELSGAEQARKYGKRPPLKRGNRTPGS